MSDPAAAAGPAPLSYAAVRWRGCRATLQAAVRRWAVHLALGALVLGGGGAASPAAVGGLAAAVVLPLFTAMHRSLPLGALAALCYGAAGALLARAMRPLLWQSAWTEAERALPIASSTKRRSDLALVAAGLLPLWGVYAAGGAIALSNGPDWIAAMRVRAVLGLVAAALIAVALGSAWLARERRVDVRAAGGLRAAASAARVGPWRALFVLPLLRTRARRAWHLGALAIATLLALCALLRAWPAATGWWLAAIALLLAAATARLRTMLDADLESLHAQCSALPLARRLTMTRRALASVPAAVGVVVLVALLPFVPGVRPVVAGFFVVVLAAGSAVLAMSEVRREPAEQLLRWLLVVATTVAAGSDVQA